MSNPITATVPDRVATNTERIQITRQRLKQRAETG
jgi:hypothetical protein